MKVKHLFPILATEKIDETLEFHTRFLGFEYRGKYPEDNPCPISLRNDKTEIAFNLPNDHIEFEKPFLTSSIYLHVENIDEVWEKLKEKVEIVYEPENFEYGMREFGIKDCNGYVLNLGENIE